MSHGRDWTEDAACRRVDPEVFFPIAADGVAGGREIAAAKAVCARCPVAADCLAWALRAGEAYGVWGGATPAERRELRRTHPRPAGPQVPARAWAGPASLPPAGGRRA